MISFFTTVAAHPIIVLFILANLVIGFWAHTKAKGNSFEDYALASRSLPTGVLVMTLLGTRLGSGDLGQPDNIFQVGIVATLTTIAFLISFFVTGTFIAPTLVYFPKSITMGDLMGQFYGRTAKLFTGIIGCLFSMLIISAQLEAIGRIGKELLSIRYEYIVFFFGLFVVLYSVYGGMRSVSYTDVLQMIIAFTILGYIVQAMIQALGGRPLFSSLPEDKITFFSHPSFLYKMKSSAVWGLFPTFIFTPPLAQRMLMIRNKKEVRKMWYASALIYGIIRVLLILVGMLALVGMAHFKLESNSKNILIRIINFLFKGKAFIIDLIFLGFVGVFLSTIDSYLHAIGVSLVQDVLNPLDQTFFGKKSSRHSKTNYAKLGSACIGVAMICIAVWGQSSVFYNHEIHKVALIVINMMLIPLIIGILGIKTDSSSLISFTLVYSVVVGSVIFGGWHNQEVFYNRFLIGNLAAVIAYFATHIYINGGILTLKRSKQSVSERLWLPTWQGTVSCFKSWLLAPFKLHILASRKTVNSPTQSLSFSMLVFALYTFSSVMTGGRADIGLANFMACVHLIGITLCCGLMLEGIWPSKLKPYFSLYWFVTLFYCLPLGGTLAFLRVHEGAVSGALWIGSFILLAILVDSTSFITLSILGASIAFGGWYMSRGSLPSSLWSAEANVMALLILVILIMGIVFFGKNKEKYSSQRLDWNRTAGSILGHDLRNTANMLSGIANVINSTFKMSEPVVNAKGKEGYWIEKQHGKFIEEYAQKLTQKSTETKQEIKNFMGFMEQQVMGWFEQEKMNMHKTVKDVVASMKDKYASNMKITVSCPKDFEVNVFSVFPNVIANLIKNASVHGQATKLTIKIDGVKRTLTVRDNGKGISEDVLPHIFDLNFTTADKGKKNAGVGLAFVKMIMNASSGKISCHSRKGDQKSFTEFVMSFPEA